MLYFKKTPRIFQSIFSGFEWSGNKATDGKKYIYLTFDDGPIPEVTPWVLEELRKYNARATFFCVGENVKNNISIYNNIIKDGHAVGNHTFNHLNGWNTDIELYINNVKKCKDYIDSNLFRPPYGKLKYSQYKLLKDDYRLIMWDVLCGDFDKRLKAEQCFNFIKDKIENGSIIVLHDNIKTFEKVKFILPNLLRYCQSEGFVFELL